MSDVQFKTIEREDGSKEEIVEVRLNDATTAVFKPDELVQGTNRTYKDVYAGRYQEFKHGKKDENVIRPEPSEDDERRAQTKPLDKTADNKVQNRVSPLVNRVDEQTRKATVTGPTIDNTVKGREPAVRHTPVKKTAVKSGKRK